MVVSVLTIGFSSNNKISCGVISTVIDSVSSRFVMWNKLTSVKPRTYGGMRYAYRKLAGITDGDRPLGLATCTRKDNTELDLKQAGCEDEDWIQVAQDIPIIEYCEHDNDATVSIKDSAGCLSNSREDLCSMVLISEHTHLLTHSLTHSLHGSGYYLRS
jgi:hypothetical protein